MSETILLKSVYSYSLIKKESGEICKRLTPIMIIHNYLYTPVRYTSLLPVPHFAHHTPIRTVAFPSNPVASEHVIELDPLRLTTTSHVSSSPVECFSDRRL
jgi:hypothetical protein